MSNRGTRYAERVKKWALAIAVDSGLSVVNDECLDRGVAIVKYELAVKNFLRATSASNREAALQQTIRRILEAAHGQMTERELRKKGKFDDVGTSLWNQAFFGLQKSGIIRAIGKGTKGDPRVVQTLVKLDREES